MNAGKELPGEDFDLAAPQAAALVESLRAFSYELPTAIADLIDNSITAGARNIWVDFYWAGSASTITITDDGCGMTAEKLVAAMRPGSQSPLAAREPHDLGRFGLGLKTASFSQCRRLTVRTTAHGGETATRCWDLDHVAQVNEWRLLRLADGAAELPLKRLKDLSSGTAVVWQKLDRLVTNHQTGNDGEHQAFLQQADAVRQHIGMTFHLLMSGSRSVKILLNERSVEPWDPFLAREPATQMLPVTSINLRGAIVEVEPFVLPHHSKLSRPAHDAASGSRGWNAHQGFYVYRNRRLLVPGSWLNFGWKKEEHYKLARIRVEVPNALDHEWAIDVTKSRAVPPLELRHELRRIGERVRSDAKRVYTHRGAKLTSRADAERVLLWEPVARRDRTFYQLNRRHPLLKQAVAFSSDKAALSALLRLIEETVPHPHITIENSEKPRSMADPFEQVDERQVREVMQQTFRALEAAGFSRREAVGRLRTIWPFELFPALLESLDDPHE